MKENYDSLQNYYTQLGGYSLAHNTVYDSNITQGVILLATTDLVFQIFRIRDEKLKEYQQKFLDRVETYYSLINK
jgi:genome maintenance exonuclease 1